jgi:hypothetical protein
MGAGSNVRMSNDFERMLQETLCDLADEGQPVNLAGQAIRRGKQAAIRQRIAVGALPLLVVAMIVMPFGLLDRLSGQHHPAPGGGWSGSAAPSPNSSITRSPISLDTDKPTVLSNKLIIGSFYVKDASSKVYNRNTKTYATVNFATAALAPKGTLVAVQDPDSQRVGVLDLATNQVKWMSSGLVAANHIMEWSEDAKYLLYTGMASSGSVSAMILDVSTMRATAVTGALECAERCAPHWMAGYRSIGFNQPTSNGLWHLECYGIDGTKQTGVSGLYGEVLSGSAWSPSGRYVVTAEQGSTAAWITDTQNIQRTARLEYSVTDRNIASKIYSQPNRTDSSAAANVYWITEDQLILVAPSSITRYSFDGSELELFPLTSSNLATQDRRIALTTQG